MLVWDDLYGLHNSLIWFQNISQLEINIARLTASKIKCKEWLHEEISKTEELDQQK